LFVCFCQVPKIVANTVIRRCIVIMLYRMLDALADRTEPSNVKGTILVDGQKRPSGFKFMTGYVVQVTTTTTTTTTTTVLVVVTV